MNNSGFHYIGDYENEINNGMIFLDSVIIETWLNRNKSQKNRNNNAQVYFNSKISNEGNVKIIKLLDPSITRLLIETGARDYCDFLDINPNEINEVNRKRVNVNLENKIYFPESILALAGIRSKVRIIGNENYIELWNPSTWESYIAENSLDPDENGKYISEEILGKNKTKFCDTYFI